MNSNFAIYYDEEAYSTAKKIMGRQSAGKAFMKGVARCWSEGDLHGIGLGSSAPKRMLAQLHQDGFQGRLQWSTFPGSSRDDALGAIYYPAPLPKELAFARNSRNPAAYSLFGVTHTLSSTGVMDQLAHLVLPPFKPWDALICTSQAALTVVKRLQEELKVWMAESMGVSRFNPLVLPVIPLGVNVSEFACSVTDRADARKCLSIDRDEVVFLFAGRLSFHAKANPVVFYQALEDVAQTAKCKLICLEAGVCSNDGIRNGFEQAAAKLAPSVRFLRVDGRNEQEYQNAWRGADVFVSLSDNIQETFGITPIEAMAAGLPVLVSDWNGYKDTVRDGVDGYRIPVLMAPPGSGRDLAYRHAIGIDTYDFYIGRVSLATAVDRGVLVQRIKTLVERPELREAFGKAGQKRVQELYDWPVILMQYVDLVDELEKIRRSAGAVKAQPWPNRPDPFSLFSHYSTNSLSGNWLVNVTARQSAALQDLLGLEMVAYGFDPEILVADDIVALHHLAANNTFTVQRLVEAAGGVVPRHVRALMWCNKAGLVDFHMP